MKNNDFVLFAIITFFIFTINSHDKAIKLHEERIVALEKKNLEVNQKIFDINILLLDKAIYKRTEEIKAELATHTIGE